MSFGVAYADRTDEIARDRRRLNRLLQLDYEAQLDRLAQQVQQDQQHRSLLTVRSTISQDLARGTSFTADANLASFVKEQHPLSLRSDSQDFRAFPSSDLSSPSVVRDVSMKRSRKKIVNSPSEDNLKKRLRTSGKKAEARTRSENVEDRSQTSYEVTDKVDGAQETSSMAGSVSFAQHTT